MEDFTVSIDKFEGPLDLMLHLIKEQQLDLFDLDISVLTDQYLFYLRKMEHMHLEIASEYLVELATLLEYKSKRMLPKDDSKLDEEYEEDPKDRLVRRLLEYQQFKEITSELDTLYHQRQLEYAKPISNNIDQWIKDVDTLPIEGSPYDLVKAMTKCLRRFQLTKPIETKYTAKEVSMEDRELQIKARLQHLPSTFNFETLLEDCEDQMMVIVTFLAILDLSRLHTLVFTVDENDTIWFSRGQA